MFKMLVTELAKSPDIQVESSIREKCQRFTGSESEAYDLLVEVNKAKCPEDISSFVRELTNVEKYYTRPNAKG